MLNFTSICDRETYLQKTAEAQQSQLTTTDTEIGFSSEDNLFCYALFRMETDIGRKTGEKTVITLTGLVCLKRNMTISAAFLLHMEM